MNEAFTELRLALFRLLQAAYAAPVTPDLAEALREAAQVYLDLIGQTAPPLEEPDLTADEAEFNRLFVGPGFLVAPPFESVYRSPEKVLMQAETLAVRHFYRRHGMELAPDRHEPDDHVAFELEFYAYLHTIQPPGNRVQAMQRFCTEHLNHWVPAFCDRIVEGTRSPFYRSLAIITRKVILAERQVLPAIALQPREKEDVVL